MCTEPRLPIDGFVSLPLEPRYARSHSHLPNPGDPCAPRLEATDMPGLFVQVEIDARILAGLAQILAFRRSTVPGGERSALLHAGPWQVSSLFLGGNFIMVVWAIAGLPGSS